MVFQKYAAKMKYLAVKLAQEGKSLTEVNDHLAATISPDSLARWTSLYERTRAVVCNPDTYLARGRPLELMLEDIQFIKDLVTNRPTLYLEEIRQSLFEANGIQVSLQTISNTLHNRLNMSQKKTQTVHPNQDNEERATYINQIAEIPSECLVFTGEQTYIMACWMLYC